jgi:lipopolysaccharide/colanic/teichoic acid biosynthesis glycosyltransferase
MDIVVSGFLLLVAAPILLLAALIIWITSPGPILFRQVRMGRAFQPFNILKLRTMTHAEGGLEYTLGADPRITSIGRLLRQTKLDELPQLWNVLRGDMSLVGPRPVLPQLTQEFRRQYAFLLRIRPGLTDPASIKYVRETELLARAPDPMDFFKSVVTPDKLRISFAYMGRANLWTDAVVLGMTVVVCFFPSASRIYGDLPEVLAALPATQSPVKQSKVRRRPKRSYVVTNVRRFARADAPTEKTVENGAHDAYKPWIPSPDSDFQSQSSSSTARESASLL